MLGKLNGLTINRDTSQNITVTVNEDFRETYDKLKDHDISIEIKRATKKRSRDANDYFWWLCSEIAKASSKYSTDGKNEVYREAIKAKGEYTSLLVREDVVNTFLRRWSEKGTGWFAEVIDDFVNPADLYSDVMGDPVDRYKVVHAYNGSSTYDSLAMSHIIDYVVLIANDAGVQTMTEAEKERLITAWAKKKGEDV